MAYPSAPAKKTGAVNIALVVVTLVLTAMFAASPLVAAKNPEPGGGGPNPAPPTLSEPFALYLRHDGAAGLGTPAPGANSLSLDPPTGPVNSTAVAPGSWFGVIDAVNVDSLNITVWAGTVVRGGAGITPGPPHYVCPPRPLPQYVCAPYPWVGAGAGQEPLRMVLVSRVDGVETMLLDKWVYAWPPLLDGPSIKYSTMLQGPIEIPAGEVGLYLESTAVVLMSGWYPSCVGFRTECR